MSAVEKPQRVLLNGGELIASFIRAERRRGLTDSSAEKYGEIIRTFADHDRSVALFDRTTEHVVLWLHDRTHQLSPRTRHVYLTALHSFYLWATAGEPVLGPPKTARSYRTIQLADVALEALARHVEAFGTGEGGLVLHEVGRPVRRQRFGKVWRALRRRAGQADPECAACEGTGQVKADRCACVWIGAATARFHDTRHTYASVLLSGGVSVAAAADYLGHSPAVLLKTYAHLIPADHDRARAVVQKAFTQRGEVAIV